MSNTIEWQLVQADIDEVIPYDKNPRQLTDKQFRDLSDSLSRFGLIDKPILNADYTVIGGHQRLEVLKAKGVRQVDCWVADRVLDAHEVQELNVRLNANHGSWDFDILANDFDVGDLLDWGFDEEDLGLSKPEKKAKKQVFSIALEFSDKDTMLEYIQDAELIAQKSSAKMKIKG